MSCRACGLFGHNVRSCSSLKADDTYDPPIDGYMCISCGERHEGDCWGDAPAAFDPRDLGPWTDCPVGDPWCPCHGAHA